MEVELLTQRHQGGFTTLLGTSENQGGDSRECNVVPGLSLRSCSRTSCTREILDPVVTVENRSVVVHRGTDKKARTWRVSW